MIRIPPLRFSRLRRLGLTLIALGIAGCSGGMEDLQQYVLEVKARPGGRIEPLPQIKPYETFQYQAATMRAPFTADVPERREGPVDGPTPELNRNPEFLEQFPLDTLRMVGTLELTGELYALVRDGTGLVHRVTPGNYVGQNDGRIVAINESAIDLVELVPDGLGGYLERPAALALSE